MEFRELLWRLRLFRAFRAAFHKPHDLVRCDETIVIGVILTELVHAPAAFPPFLNRDLAVMVLVEFFEPRRQVLGDVTARRGHYRDGQRKFAGFIAVLTCRNDAVNSRASRSIHNTRDLSPAAAVVLVQD